MNSADNTPYTGTKKLYNDHSPQCGAVAQLGERFNGIEEVRSSSLLSSTTIFVTKATLFRIHPELHLEKWAHLYSALSRHV